MRLMQQETDCTRRLQEQAEDIRRLMQQADSFQRLGQQAEAAQRLVALCTDPDSEVIRNRDEASVTAKQLSDAVAE